RHTLVRQADGCVHFAETAADFMPGFRDVGRYEIDAGHDEPDRGMRAKRRIEVVRMDASRHVNDGSSGGNVGRTLHPHDATSLKDACTRKAPTREYAIAFRIQHDMEQRGC